MGAFDLLARGAAKGAKKVAPFFSKVDEVLESLPRNKGTGDEFLREIEKTKGVKPAEIQDRGIAKALKGKPKMTKAEVQKIFESNPPPRVQEKVLSSDVPDYDDWLENKAQEIYGVDWFDLSRDQQKALDKMFGALDLTQYDKYKTPGGENYREILLKLPAFDNKRVMELEADIRRSEGAYKDPMSAPDFRAKVEELAQLKQQQAAAGTPYISSHYKTDPNLLAHIRVQDFQAPTRGFTVVNTRSGNKSEVFPTMEQAQAYLAQMPGNMQGMLRIDEAAGKPKKVLLVDEIQSDWHQEGRKKGYKQEPKKSWLVKKPGDKVHGSYDSEEEATNAMKSLARAYGEEPRRLGLSIEEGIAPDYSGAVPDAPFKKNWHELAMKRVLDYAAENGYDTVAITPGVQQVKRYEDATRQAVDEVALYGDTLVGFKGGRRVIEQPISSPDELEQYIGKDMAQKLSSAAPDMNFIRSIKGEDITVGGEGMKGFYDKILTDYLNNFGKPYGSSVGQSDLVTQPSKIEKAGSSYYQTAQKTMPVHTFDITPQLRDEVKTKGLPLYGKMGMGPEGLAAGTGAATIGSQMFDENNEQQVQNPVHFTENPDAMLLELMQRN